MNKSLCVDYNKIQFDGKIMKPKWLSIKNPKISMIARQPICLKLAVSLRIFGSVRMTSLIDESFHVNKIAQIKFAVRNFQNFS